MEQCILEARYYQISYEEAIALNKIDLFGDGEKDELKHLSRADLILIYSLYDGGIDEFLEDYKSYAMDSKSAKGYKFVNKPHYYLKNRIG